MKAVALAAKARSLADFQKAVKAYKVHGEMVIQTKILGSQQIDKSVLRPMFSITTTHSLNTPALQQLVTTLQSQDDSNLPKKAITTHSTWWQQKH